MVKSITLNIRISEEQNKILVQKMRDAGFIKRSDYIRSTLFRSSSVEEKIDKIFAKVCKDGRKL